MHFLCAGKMALSILLRMTMFSALGAPTTLAVRRNVMWALEELPIKPVLAQTIHGLDFVEMYVGRDLYFGGLDARLDTQRLALEARSNQTIVASEADTVSKRALGLKSTFALPGTCNSHYSIRFHHFAGYLLLEREIYGTILNLLLNLGAKPADEAVGWMEVQ